jgi:hypothetical protein
LCLGLRGAERGDGGFDVGGLAPIDGDLGAILRQRLGDRAADALGGSSDERAQSGKIELHDVFALGGKIVKFRMLGQIGAHE